MPHPIRVTFYDRPGWSSFYRRNAAGAMHAANDYYVPAGTDVYATGPGVVLATGYGEDKANGYGYWVRIGLDNGNETIDAHFAAPARVRKGQRVDANTVIGDVGNTGNAWNVFYVRDGLTLSHDHHKLWVRGVLTDPLAYYGTAAAGGPGTPITPEQGDNDMPRVIHDVTGGSISLIGPPGSLYHAPDVPAAVYLAKYHNKGSWDDVTHEEYLVLTAAARGNVAVGGVDQAALIAAVVAAIKATPATAVIDDDALLADVRATVEQALAADNDTPIPLALGDVDRAWLAAQFDEIPAETADQIDARERERLGVVDEA